MTELTGLSLLLLGLSLLTYGIHGKRVNMRDFIRLMIVGFLNVYAALICGIGAGDPPVAAGLGIWLLLQALVTIGGFALCAGSLLRLAKRPMRDVLIVAGLLALSTYLGWLGLSSLRAAFA